MKDFVTSLALPYPNTRQVLGADQTDASEHLPHGAWDCHVHVFERELEFPYFEGRVFTPGQAPLTALRDMRAAVGLAHSVIIQASAYGTDNRLLLDALAREEGRARGIAVIDEKVTDAELRAWHEAGVRGVRLNLETFGRSDPAEAKAALEALAARVSPLGWHVQIYSRLPVFQVLFPLFDNLPCPVVLDHFAGVHAGAGVEQLGFRELLDVLRGGNVYVKLSAPSRISGRADQTDVQAVVNALVAANPARMLWGSDWPHTGGHRSAERHREGVEPFKPIDDGANLIQLANWLTDPALRQALWVDNPSGLYR
jgi:predicted TIM-barrel fold metal-dependent hydrolase